MSFWNSNLGEVTTDEASAFAQQFQNIPNNSYLGAKVYEFEEKNHEGNRYLELTWQICGTEYDGQLVRQKIKCYDYDDKVRHRSLCMFKRLHELMGYQIADRQPTPMDLQRFKTRKAGIKVQETDPMPESGKQYNWVSEVHDPKGFQVKIGESKPVPAEKTVSVQPKTSYLGVSDPEMDDVPF